MFVSSMVSDNPHDRFYLHSICSQSRSRRRPFGMMDITIIYGRLTVISFVCLHIDPDCRLGVTAGP